MFRLALIACLLPGLAAALPEDASFASIDGGRIDLAAHDGPILLVNTASMCAFTPQYEALQRVHDRYAEAGLMVLAVPSDDFGQELADGAAVAEFCEVTFGLTLPMADITPVRGDAAHPVYAWLRAEAGFAPRWNFDKALIDGGEVVETWRSRTRPDGRSVTRAIEASLGE